MVMTQGITTVNYFQKVLPIGIAAHRGYAAKYPENTMLAIQAAVDAKVFSIEVDIQFSQDGIPFLFHDVDFERIANVSTRIFETTMKDIKKIPILKPKNIDSSSDLYSSTLAEFVDYLRANPKVQAFIEIKPDSINHFGVQFVIRQLEQELKSVRKQCLIICYSAEFLQNVREQLGLPIGHILTIWNDKNLGDADKLKPEFVVCNHTKIPDDTNFREYSWQWLLYEVTECDHLLSLAQQGVQWVESKNPEKLMQCLEGIQENG